MQKIPLTKNMKRVLLFITDFIQSNSSAPSFEEIKDGAGFKNKSEVARYIMCLKDRGWLTYQRYKKRTIRIL
jgi:SOS-response transcriptional repressor LexA